MSVRKASTALARVSVHPPLLEREPGATDPGWGALAWQGSVRLAADRASGLSAPRWQQHVRTGLLERVLVLGSDHWIGPHVERPEVGRRLLAHIDALAEAGLSLAELRTFADEADLERPGVLWVLAILTTCLDVGGVEEAFEAWITSLDPSLLLSYRGVREIASALMVAPNPALLAHARRWTHGSTESLVAIALEVTRADELSENAFHRLVGMDSPIVHAALDRLLLRSEGTTQLHAMTRASWLDLPFPALSYEIARARLLGRDLEPLLRLRARDPRAIAALGTHALDVLALAADGSDEALVTELARGFPTMPSVVDAMGRLGLRALFPRLVAELSNDDVDDEAHRALETALGRRGPRISVAEWEAVIAALPDTDEPVRLRGGQPHTPRSVLAEIQHPDLSAMEIEVRAEEIFVKTGRSLSLEWGAFGTSLDRAVSEVARIVR